MTTEARVRGLALAALLLAATVAPVAAETVFDEYGPDTRPRPTQQVFEASCDLDVQLRGAVAAVEIRQRLVNPGPDPLAVTYGFDLPAEARLTGFALRGERGVDRGVERGIAVPADASAVQVSAQQVLGADPALVVALDEDSYAVRLQPIAPDHDVVMTTRFATLAEVRAGALRLTLPGRAAVGKLTACRGTIRAAAGPGATIARLRVDGTETGSRGVAGFVVDTKDVVIDAELAFARREPVVWTQTEALTDGWSATLITVAAPPARTTASRGAARRALLVIDGSRSMELVGRHHTAKVVHAIGSALPTGTTIDAILFDRTAARVHGAFVPLTPQVLAKIEREVATRPATNGTDLPGALALAHAAISDGARDTTTVIVISDGVIGDHTGQDLTRALDAKTSTVDVLSVVLDPAGTQSPGAAAVRAPVSVYGGAFVEIAVGDLDRRLAVVDEWLRPSWIELAMGGAIDVPYAVLAGSGFTQAVVHRGPASRFVLTGRGETAIKVAPRAAPAAPVAALALAQAPRHVFVTTGDPTTDARAEKTRARAHAMHPWATLDVSFAVLTTTGRVARNRIAMVRGGGPYERLVEVTDPPERAPVPPPASAATTPSAIARLTLERMFRDQLQPRAYACYQRALGKAPKLAGTAHYTLHLGRGEITQVVVAGLGDAAFDACLVDAAYALAVPLPDLSINADDQTIARYPLTFELSERRPHVVAGDADSTSPIDIDAIQGGLPTTRRAKVKVHTHSPLGGMRPRP